MLYGVIMAGGSGTRFWPQSRKIRPKQLLRIVDDRTMIRATVERLLSEIPFERIMVVTGVSHAEEIRAELPELGERMVISGRASRAQHGPLHCACRLPNCQRRPQCSYGRSPRLTI